MTVAYDDVITIGVRLQVSPSRLDCNARFDRVTVAHDDVTMIGVKGSLGLVLSDDM